MDDHETTPSRPIRHAAPMSPRRRFLVTGAAGFIGTETIRQLLERGDEVVGVDSFSDYYDVRRKHENVASHGGALDVVTADLLDADLDELLEGVDVVIHLAGQPGVRKSWGDDFSIYTRSNIDATQRLLEAVRRTDGVHRFLYASSSSIYGQAETYPTSERTIPQPFSPYGVTKLAAEHMGLLYRANFGIPVSAFRFFTVYGPRQRPDMAFTRFLTAAENDREITIYGTGEQIRDFTYVSDIVSALLRASDASGELPPVMNLSGGSSTSVNEVLGLIGALTGKTLRVTKQPSARGDVFRTGGLSEVAADALGWRPEVDLEEGLRRQLDWVRLQLAAR